MTAGWRDVGRALPLGAILLGAACTPEKPTTTTPEPDPPPPVQPEPTTCGEPDLRFEELSWLPDDTQAVVRVDTRNPELARALDHLATHTRGDDHGLPIDLAFALGGLSFQVPSLVESLDRLGLSPGELVLVRPPREAGAWIVRYHCPLSELGPRLHAAWGRTLHGEVGGSVASAGSAGEPGLVLLPDDRLAIVPPGTESAWLSRLSARPRQPPTAASRLRAALNDASAEGPAPIVGAAMGPALLQPSEYEPPAISPPPVRELSDGFRLRVDARGVSIDATVPSP